jgi:hypothetical protein
VTSFLATFGPELALAAAILLCAVAVSFVCSGGRCKGE